jgi:uncharacterized protein (TIGR02246 family)
MTNTRSRDCRLQIADCRLIENRRMLARLATGASAIVLLLTVAGVRAADPAASTPRELLATLQRADNTNDLETVLALYADDAVLLPPGETTVRDKPAIRARYTSLFQRTRMAARFEIDEERTAGGVSYIRGRTIGRRTATDGRVEDLTGKFVMLLRQDGGRWRITSLIWNTDK